MCSLQLLDELYHQDKGLNCSRMVILAKQKPSGALKHVLLTHDASKKVVYLQGSPFKYDVSIR